MLTNWQSVFLCGIAVVNGSCTPHNSLTVTDSPAQSPVATWPSDDKNWMLSLQATIMTDPGTADRTYIGPMTPELVEEIIKKVRPILCRSGLRGHHPFSIQ